MENVNRVNDVVLLGDFSKDAQRLHSTLKLAKIDVDTIVIDSDGFAPDDITCVYEYYLNEDEVKIEGKALYFNQVDVPDFWEISGNNTSGVISNLNKEKARIYYAEPQNKRIVKVVEWLDDKKVVRASDHYNKYGKIYARTTFNKKGERVTKSYFSSLGKEIIVENFVTSDIILNYKGKTTIFNNRTEFVKNFLIERGYESSRIFYNSLSYPFFVSQIMPAKHKDDVLFWQEKARNDIPGNMLPIINRSANRTAKVMVMTKGAYDKFIDLGAPEEIVNMLGYIYEYKRNNNYGHDILICTNSDQIVELENIITALPQMHIHIAAVTEMSTKLTCMEKYDNVSLYPAADDKTIESLFNKCDYYLDINRHGEIVDALYRAFINNQVIMGFRETLHNDNYIDISNVYEADDWEQMVKKIEKCCSDDSYVDELIGLQQVAAASIESELLMQAIE